MKITLASFYGNGIMKEKVECMKKKIGILFLILAVLCFIFIIVFGLCLKIELIGKNETTIEVGEKDPKPEIKASSLGISLNSYIKSTGKVNEKKVGTYHIKYSVQVGLFRKEVSRTVHVVDTKKPELTLLGDSEILLYVGEAYSEPGAEATDAYDGNLNEKIQIESNVDTNIAGDYTVTYSVKDSSGNENQITRSVHVKEKPLHTREVKDGLTYIDGILIVNKEISVPSTYAPGVNEEARNALTNLQNAAKQAGYDMPLLSGYRSYQRQSVLYQNYVNRDGEEKASTYSAKPGHSEHQTGLAFDIGELSNTYGETPAGKWLEENAYLYGFIIRYPKGKENITGYQYEPWHVRYLGTSIAKDVYQRGVTLEEYLGLV